MVRISIWVYSYCIVNSSPYILDLPDDFKYGVSVYESAPEVRQAFIRKVYTILFAQILG